MVAAMSSALEFFAWFDGLCEGIDKVPNAKQWEKIKERVQVERERLSKPVMRDVAGDEPPKPTRAKKPELVATDRASWMAIYTARLIELGCDEETAKEFARDVRYDKDIDPKEVAQQDFDQFAKGAAA
jgi:hypothetical protein